jgi:hypothetical protein
VIPGITLAELFKAGPVALLACGVWYEVHEMRASFQQLGAAVAVLLDRADCHTAPAEPSHVAPG